MSTRSKLFIAGIVTGYGSLAVNIVFTMTSIPLALHYLDKEQFALWALALQINGYLSFVDLGMSGAVSRFLANYKDDLHGGEYGSHLLTGAIIFLIQGFIIAFAGSVFSWFAPSLFAIPHHLASTFRSLLIFLSCTAGVSVALRSLASPLWSFQRNDVINICSTIGLWVTFAMLWFGFKSGWGVMSFAYAQIPVVAGTLIVHTSICVRNRYYPPKGHWGRPSLTIFRKMFHFGKDNLLINIGTQLINASQIMILSRFVSLDAAATYSVATKFYNLAMQMVCNPVSSSAAGLTEIHVRGDINTFVKRYWDLISLVLTISTVSAVCLAVGNRPLVALWTSNVIPWTWQNDLILGLLIVVRNISGCFIGLFGILGDWRPVRHVCILEGVVFVPLAILLAQSHGIQGLLLASLIAHLFVTTAMAARAASRILGSWLQIRTGIVSSLGLVAGAGFLAWTGYNASFNDIAMLGVTALAGLIAIVAAWYLITSHHIKIHILSKLKIMRSRIS